MPPTTAFPRLLRILSASPAEMCRRVAPLRKKSDHNFPPLEKEVLHQQQVELHFAMAARTETTVDGRAIIPCSYLYIHLKSTAQFIAASDIRHVLCRFVSSVSGLSRCRSAMMASGRSTAEHGGDSSKSRSRSGDSCRSNRRCSVGCGEKGRRRERRAGLGSARTAATPGLLTRQLVLLGCLLGTHCQQRKF